MADPKPASNKNTQLFVRINNPEHSLFEDVANAVTSYNKRGVFDILLFHENFITLIKTSVTIHRDKQEPMIIPVETGILKVYENTVNILVGIKTVTEKPSLP